MLPILIKIITYCIMPISGFFVISFLSGTFEKKLSIKNILILIVMSILNFLIYQTKYNSLITILNFAILVLGYKLIFNFSLFNTVLYCGFVLFFSIVADLFVYIILSIIFSTELIRGNDYIMLLSNFLVGIFTILFSMLKVIKIITNKIILKFSKKQSLQAIILILLWIIVISFLLYLLSINLIDSLGFGIIVSIELIFIIFIMIYFKEKIHNISLNEKFDTLFSYIQDVEKWIDEEQLNLHEYKNQMAVIKTMTNNKKVNNYIDDIIKCKYNDSVAIQLKELPTGGIKGLIYYKIILAKNNNLNITINISKDVTKCINKINLDDTKQLCRVLGIYLDNAIEAAKDTRIKAISLEMYIINKSLNIVISNSINKAVDVSNIKKRGISSKGKGRGNGLYLANKIVNENSLFDSDTRIINNYYVQKLTINRK